MNNADFWTEIKSIIKRGFDTKGLQKLDYYAELFVRGKLVFKRFSPTEQYGCTKGGSTNVIATLLAGAKNQADTDVEGNVGGVKDDFQLGAQQEKIIEQWSRKVGCWIDDVDAVLTKKLGKRIAHGGEANVYDHGAEVVKTIGLDYFILPELALDRISLHNTYFPETTLLVLGFGRDSDGNFKIIAQQPFIDGNHISDDEIADYMDCMGFELKNPHNWTYATPEIYLSDMHDENVIRSASGAVFVVDCDIRINTPELRQGGVRTLTNEVLFNLPFP